MRRKIIGWNLERSERFKRRKCALIFTPNDAVLDQWEEALIASGVSPFKVIVFDKNQNKQTDGFLLATKSNLELDMKYLIAQRRPSSGIFHRNIPNGILDILSNLYHAEKGNADPNPKYRHGRETYEESITRQLKDSARKFTRAPEFEFLIFDESQELKNVCALCGENFLVQNSKWSFFQFYMHILIFTFLLLIGMGSALLALYSERTVLCSGTPYSNKLQDLATQMLIIDNSHAASSVSW